MNEEKENSKKHEQYKGRPKFETFISETVVDDKMKTAMLDFAVYLRENKMPPQWTAINSWKFLYKKQRVGYIRYIHDKFFFDYNINP